jgi:hypothetical protein
MFSHRFITKDFNGLKKGGENKYIFEGISVHLGEKGTKKVCDLYDCEMSNVQFKFCKSHKPGKRDT